MGTLKTVGYLRAALANIPDDAAVIGLDSMRITTVTCADGSKEHVVCFRPAGVFYGRELEITRFDGDVIEIRER
jgi:hypothetical protein